MDLDLDPENKELCRFLTELKNATNNPLADSPPECGNKPIIEEVARSLVYSLKDENREEYVIPHLKGIFR